MDTGVTVICCLLGTKWPDVWVHRLHRMVEQNCSIPFQFRVITDRWLDFPEWGVEFSREIVWTDEHHSRLRDDPRMILNRSKPQGCWGKLDGFLASFGAGPKLILDLDIVILRDIAPLIRKHPSMPVDGQGRFNGSVYSWTGIRDDVYPKNIPYSVYPRGEQEYAAEALKAEPLEGCYSYKYSVASSHGRNPPKDARIIYFHGNPTPAAQECRNLKWVGDTWKGLEVEDRL